MPWSAPGTATRLVARPGAAARNCRAAGQLASHRERLGQYEADWAAVRGRHGGGSPPVTHPDFGNYATLRFGLAYARERIGWLEWMSQQLGAAGDPVSS